MMKKILLISCVIISGLTSTAYAQFQTFPVTTTNSISGDKISVVKNRPTVNNHKRYIENNKKKKKIKTERKISRNQTCSNFMFFYSEKSASRKKAISRKKRKRS